MKLFQKEIYLVMFDLTKIAAIAFVLMFAPRHSNAQDGSEQESSSAVNVTVNATDIQARFGFNPILLSALAPNVSSSLVPFLVASGYFNGHGGPGAGHPYGHGGYGSLFGGK